MRRSALNTKGFGLTGVLAIVVVLVVVGGTAALVYHRNHKPKAVAENAATSTQSGKGSSAKSSTDASKAATTPDPYAGWKQYCSAQEKSCFKYPSGWTTKNVGAVDPAGDGIQLTSPSGTIIWFQSAVSGLGGECQPGTPDVFIHKVIPAPKVANLYVVESGTQSVVNHIGLVNGSNGQAPKIGDTGTCAYVRTFKSKHDPSMDAWLESNGVNNFKSSDLGAAELILESYTY